VIKVYGSWGHIADKLVRGIGVVKVDGLMMAIDYGSGQLI
jgi:hypothetical protein